MLSFNGNITLRQKHVSNIFSSFFTVQPLANYKCENTASNVKLIQFTSKPYSCGIGQHINVTLK